MNIYLFSHYNVNGLGISQRYWKISSSSFEVEAKTPPPSASPPEIGDCLNLSGFGGDFPIPPQNTYAIVSVSKNNLKYLETGHYPKT